MNRKTVGLTSRITILALTFIMVAGLALLPLDGVAYAQTAAAPVLTASPTPDGSSVSVSWTEVTGATSYQLYRQANGGAWTNMNITGRTYSDANVSAGMTYVYYVHGLPVPAGDPVAWSNAVTVTLPGDVSLPSAPANLAANADGLTAVDVSWDAVSDAASYDLYRWDHGAGTGATIYSGASMSYRDTDVTAGTQYSYNVRAVNAAGSGSWSGYVSETLPEPVTATVPELMLKHTSREVVELSWTEVAGDPEYDLERFTDVSGGAVSDVDWARLPGALLSVREYEDDTAAYVSGSTSTRYHYRVRAVVDGTPGEWSNEVSVAIPSTANIPAAPAIRVTSTDLRSITIAWDPIEDAASYELRFKVEDGDYSTPTMRTGTSYRHTGLRSGTKYTYEVRSKNVNGYSEWSDAASAETHVRADSGEDTGVLSTPTNLSVVSATDKDKDAGQRIGLKLSWSPVSRATGYDIMVWHTGAWRYVTEAEEPASASAGVMTLTGNSVTFRGLIAIDTADRSGVDSSNGPITLMADTPYYFVLLAVRDNNNSMDMSNWSAPVRGTAKALKPDAPTNLRAIPTGSTSIWLSWDKPDSGGGTKGATGYTIDYQSSGGGSGRINVGGTTYAHTGLRPGTEYRYRVRATNSNSAASPWEPSSTGSDARGTQIRATTAPRDLEMPTGLKAADASILDATGAVTTAQVMVSWGKVSGASMYEVQKWVEPDWVSIGTTDKTSFTDKTVTDVSEVVSGGSYHYVVRATNGEVTSPWSTSVLGRARPETAGDYMPELTLIPIGQTLVRLTWTEVSGATGYELEYHSGNRDAGWFDDDKDRDTNARLTLQLPGTHRYYVHFGRKSGTRYSYRIRAILSHTKSDWSNVMQVVTRPVRPDVKASVDGTTVNLSWKPVSVDGAARGMAFYTVERREVSPTAADWVSAGITIDCENDDNSIADECTAPDDRSSDVTSTDPDHKYSYRVRVAVSSSASLDTYTSGTNTSATVPDVESYWTQVVDVTVKSP